MCPAVYLTKHWSGQYKNVLFVAVIFTFTYQGC